MQLNISQKFSSDHLSLGTIKLPNVHYSIKHSVTNTYEHHTWLQGISGTSKETEQYLQI